MSYGRFRDGTNKIDYEKMEIIKIEALENIGKTLNKILEILKTKLNRENS